MSETNEHIMDKSGFPPGPWMDEPDKLVWVDEATDLDCMIVRGPLGSLCGYVGVGPDHPHHGSSYWQHEGGPSADVHGDLTFAAKRDEEGTICHVPQPGRITDVWWFGFDCAHAWDLVPGVAYMGGTYKDIEFVRHEVTELARQLGEISHHQPEGETP